MPKGRLREKTVQQAALHWLVQYYEGENPEVAAVKSELEARILKGNVAQLRRIKGVGPKTIDYFRILCGMSTSAIDVHLYRFLARAGVEVKGYDEAQSVIRETASLMGVSERALDYSIWSYMAG